MRSKDQLLEHLDEVVDHYVQELKKRKIRITPKRRAILEYMIATEVHPTVEEVYQALLPDHPSMSLATVYNNLNLLVEEGLVHEMKFNDVVSHYDFKGHEHDHIICQQCGKIADFDYRAARQIEKEVNKQTGYYVNEVRLEVYGICPDCQAELEAQDHSKS